jgi:MoxR-like ATPase
MSEVLRAFLGGELSASDLRATFDSKTKTDWNVFGLKGTAAMFLNKLVKYLPDQEELADRLRAALPAPESVDDAGRRMAAFSDYLATLIETGVASKADIQPSRAAFFLSGWWHIQDPETWPIYFVTARDALRKREGFQPSTQPTESYRTFRDLFLHVASELKISCWEMEHVCAWLEEEKPPPPPPPPPPPGGKIWLIAPGPGAERWGEFREEGIAAIGWAALGDLRNYSKLEEYREALAGLRETDALPIHDALACYEFAHEMQEGDVVYAKRGQASVIGKGTIRSDYVYDESRGDYPHIRKVEWTEVGDWKPREKPLVTKTLTEIGQYPQLVDQIEAAIGGSKPLLPPRGGGRYEIEDAISELFFGQSEIEETQRLLQSKKNIVLQGPPGTGKTYFALRLAWLVLRSKDPTRLASVQFHQSYSYEDFVQGYRPTGEGGFERRDGPFLRFCDQALQDQENHYVLIIDEINRGNLSKILGELMMLIEADKRDPQWAIQLAYSSEDDPPFHVPPNLVVIGTMNTADRSLALVDYALRRRFAFVDVEPAFTSEAFRKHLEETLRVDSGLRERIVTRLMALNREIAADPGLGRGFRIGHSYFCNAPADDPCDEVWYERIVHTELDPLLREYWFDDEDKVEAAVGGLLEDL